MFYLQLSTNVFDKQRARHIRMLGILSFVISKSFLSTYKLNNLGSIALRSKSLSTVKI